VQLRLRSSATTWPDGFPWRIPQNPVPAQAFKQAVANSASRLSGDCLKFFQELSGITDASLLLQKMQGYLKENVDFGNTYLDGDTLQPTPFAGEGTGAITNRIEIRGQMRPGDAVTYFNAGASNFTGLVQREKLNWLADQVRDKLCN
jgi:hypothetical protein